MCVYVCEYVCQFFIYIYVYVFFLITEIFLLTMYKVEAFRSVHFRFYFCANQYVKLFMLLYLQCLFDLLVNVLHDWFIANSVQLTLRFVKKKT